MIVVLNKISVQPPFYFNLCHARMHENASPSSSRVRVESLDRQAHARWAIDQSRRGGDDYAPSPPFYACGAVSYTRRYLLDVVPSVVILITLL
jgi:hypothetical protein